MILQTPILKLQKLGRMLDDSDDSVTSELIDEYSNLLDAIQRPINAEEARVLVQLFPEFGLYGGEWSLLHLFETVYKQIDKAEYRSLIELCPSEEWKGMLTARLENGIKRDTRLKELAATAFQKLQELGQIPDDSKETDDIYIDLIDSIKRPVTLEEAEILVRLFPNDNYNGIAWNLMEAFESVYQKIDKETYLKLLEQCPSEKWKELLNNRLTKDLTGVKRS